MELFAAILGIIILLTFGKLVALSTKILWKLLMNSIAGVVLLFVFNTIGGIFNTHIAVTFVNSLIVGFLGIPGLILLLLMGN